mmetsp:Transcript_30136/g.98515  ORF Transcript_30136/g.98515 Transcript_30136/m.98515 type:complete len:241 (+) Transcript_30136:395-1117(+)
MASQQEPRQRTCGPLRRRPPRRHCSRVACTLSLTWLRKIWRCRAAGAARHRQALERGDVRPLCGGGAVSRCAGRRDAGRSQAAAASRPRGTQRRRTEWSAWRLAPGGLAKGQARTERATKRTRSRGTPETRILRHAQRQRHGPDGRLPRRTPSSRRCSDSWVRWGEARSYRKWCGMSSRHWRRRSCWWIRRTWSWSTVCGWTRPCRSTSTAWWRVSSSTAARCRRRWPTATICRSWMRQR